MSEKLFESEIFTVDLSALFNTPTSTPPITWPAKGDWAAWGDLFKEKKLDANAEADFFKNFYETNWPTDIAAKLLAIGEPLKKAIRVLGFNIKQEPGSNPLLAFVAQEYVQEQLLKTELLNVSTFKAIFNAVAGKLIADSEFYTANDYNIIYCPDLYRRKTADIANFITIQKNTLLTSASSYSPEVQIKNKKVFLYLEDVQELDNEKRTAIIKNLASDKIAGLSMKDPQAKLNNLALAEKISGTKLKGNADKSHLNSKGQSALADKLTQPSQIFAALQFLSVSTSSSKALAALNNDSFSGLDKGQIAKATSWLITHKIMPKGELSEGDADNLVSVLLGRLQQLK